LYSIKEGLSKTIFEALKPANVVGFIHFFVLKYCCIEAQFRLNGSACAGFGIHVIKSEDVAIKLKGRSFKV